MAGSTRTYVRFANVNLDNFNPQYLSTIIVYIPKSICFMFLICTTHALTLLPERTGCAQHPRRLWYCWSSCRSGCKTLIVVDEGEEDTKEEAEAPDTRL